ncbi:MAG: hypothetical protein CME64_18230 [Halobacteriovoraceae bacterium]|nr:hypothetical protein [Halobacteriovoraceae bacterium]|tara:strand:- start:15171 stop:18188 length:3018 start_codon:yes stop_codon:yes gene_type:complete
MKRIISKTNAIAFAATLLFAFSARADLNLFDLIRDGKHRYSINYYCKSFFSKEENRKKLHSQAFQDEIQSLEELGFDPYYFHYTRSQTKKKLKTFSIIHDASINKENGFRDILKHQMTYYDALSNAAGTGYYISANPFSSANYGNEQILLTVKQTAKVYDTTDKTKKKIYDSEMSRLWTVTSLNECPAKLIMSLLMDENGVDLWYYSKNSQWFSVFNEDIFEDSSILNIGSEYSSLITKKMAEEGKLAPLFDSVLEFGAKDYSIFLSELTPYLEGHSGRIVDEALKIIPFKGNELKFSNMLKLMDGQTFHEDLLTLKTLDPNFNDHLFNVSLENSSQEFKQTYLDLLLSGKKAGDNDILLKNLRLLLRWEKINTDEFIGIAKTNFDSSYTKTFTEFELDYYPKGLSAALILEGLKNPDSRTELISLQSRLILNIMKYAEPSDTSTYFSLIEKDYDLIDLFNQVKRNPILSEVNILWNQFVTTMFLYKPELLNMENARIFSSHQASYPKQLRATLLFLLGKKTTHQAVWEYYYKYAKTINTIDLSSWFNSPGLAPLLSSNEKIELFHTIFSKHGPRSQQYIDFLANAELMEKEYDLVMAMKDLSEDQRLFYIERFKDNPATSKRFANIPNEDSVWSFFTPNDKASEVTRAIIDIYESKLIRNVDMFEQHAGAEALAILSTPERILRNLDVLNNGHKVHYIVDALEREHEPFTYKQLYDSIELNIATASSIIEGLITANVQRFSEFNKLLLTRPEILSNSSLETFDRYLDHVIKGKVETLDELKLSLKNLTLDFLKAKTAILKFGNLDQEITDSIIAKNLQLSKLSQPQTDELHRAYELNYEGKRFIRVPFWDSYISKYSNDLDTAVKALPLNHLEVDHLRSIISGYFETDQTHLHLKELVESKEANVNIYSLAAKLGDDQLMSRIVEFVSPEYPTNKDYIPAFMSYYLKHNRPEFMEDHISQKLCPKIDGYKGLREWYKSAEEDDEEDARKDIWIEKCDVSWPYLW